MSSYLYTYSLSDEQLGQYISLDAWNVVGSAISIPIMAATFLAIGSYSSTVGPAIFVDDNVRNMVKLLPLDRILVETDGVEALEWLFKKKFDPRNLRNTLEAVIQELADIKQVSFDLMSDYLLANSERLLRKE